MKKVTSTKATRKSATRKTQVSTYVAISNNIYHDGSSYRVRASVEGTKVSKNFSSKRQAIAFRNSLLSA
jgi:hypothetical protein